MFSSISTLLLCTLAACISSGRVYTVRPFVRSSTNSTVFLLNFNEIWSPVSRHFRPSVNDLKLGFSGNHFQTSSSAYNKLTLQLLCCEGHFEWLWCILRPAGMIDRQCITAIRTSRHSWLQQVFSCLWNLDLSVASSTYAHLPCTTLLNSEECALLEDRERERE